MCVCVCVCVCVPGVCVYPRSSSSFFFCLLVIFLLFLLLLLLLTSPSSFFFCPFWSSLQCVRRRVPAYLCATHLSAGDCDLVVAE